MISGDTIAAISSAAGPAARMILRMTGADSFPIAAKFWNGPAPTPGSATRGHLLLRGMRIPSWLYFFRSPRSYSGEDSVELHIPGNPLLAKMLLEALLGAGARPAEPGEFTARAYFNGRLDLTEAEGVAATISAGNEQELSAARRLMAGELAQRVTPIIDIVAETLALLEVGIDFSDEDVTFLSSCDARARIEKADAMLRRLLEESVRFERLAHEPSVVLVGRPNAGKSTLLNALAGHERAVVSDVAGTTRDALSTEVALARGMVRITDVAGIEQADRLAAPLAGHFVSSAEVPHPAGKRPASGAAKRDLTADPALSPQELINSKMREHALRAVEQADVVLLLREVNDSRPTLSISRAPDFIVWSKCDLLNAPAARPGTRGNDQQNASSEIHVSAKTGEGLAELRIALDRLCFGQTSTTPALALNARHVQAIEESRAALSLAGAQVDSGPEFITLELREALDALGRITGKISPDDLLGRIFSAFCIGK